MRVARQHPRLQGLNVIQRSLKQPGHAEKASGSGDDSRCGPLGYRRNHKHPDIAGLRSERDPHSDLACPPGNQK